MQDDRPFLCFWMTLPVNGLNLLAHHLSIFLRRRNVTVPHQFLKHPQISSVFQQVNCEAMAQRMGRYLLFDSGSHLIIFQDFPKALSTHARSADVHKKCSLLLDADQHRTRLVKVICQCFRCSGINRNNAAVLSAAAFYCGKL